MYVLLYILIIAQPFVMIQVLQMSVPLDDNDSYNDLQLDFSRKNHAFTLDNVSYITKDNGDSIGKIICLVINNFHVKTLPKKSGCVPRFIYPLLNDLTNEKSGCFCNNF